jgi:hypothetical protein
MASGPRADLPSKCILPALCSAAAEVGDWLISRVTLSNEVGVRLSVCSAVFKRNVMADVEPHFVQTTEIGGTAAVGLTCCAHIDPANYRHRELLRARHQWPRRRAADERHDLAPFPLTEMHSLYLAPELLRGSPITKKEGSKRHLRLLPIHLKLALRPSLSGQTEGWLSPLFLR